MNRKFPVFAVTLAALLAVAPAALLADDDNGQNASSYQAETLFVFGNSSISVAGAATLNRTKDEISYGIHTSGLTPGGAITAWIVYFDPDLCTGSCGADDPRTVLYGGGAIADMAGHVNIYGGLAEGPFPAGRQVLRNDVDFDAQRSEIHYIVRDHGPVDPTGSAADQLGSFEIGCQVCSDVQAVIFEAVR